MNETTFTKDRNVLTIERTLDAPLDKVWEAWTTAEIFAKWWGPRGWTTTVEHMDFTPGGYLLYGMKCVDEKQGEWYGQESWGKSVYESINPKANITYKDYFCDNEGNINKEMPATDNSVHFEEVDGKTKLTCVSTFESEAALAQVLTMGMEEGVRQTWDRLAELLQ